MVHWSQSTKGVTVAKNLMGKSRKLDESPYIVLDQPGGGWKTEVLKTWQADGQKPYGRAFCKVTTPFTGGSFDLGDVYVSDLRALELVDFDRDVFANADEAAAALFGAGAVA